MSLKIVSTGLRLHNMRLRMPFRFGIVTLTECPYAMLQVEMEIDGRRAFGLSADVLPNKWFTKDPSTTYRDDITDMLKIIAGACDIARAAGKFDSLFDLWERVYQAQLAWAGGWGYAPLLAGFGASLVERAAIDAFCRDAGAPFSTVLRDNRLGLRLGRMLPELSGADPADLLAPAPLRQITARHTVGLTDPLGDGDIAVTDRVNDGLPQSLEACIAAYGLTHFKVKLWGEAAKDIARLRDIARMLTISVRGPCAFTLDGNENFHSVGAFRAFWTEMAADPALADFLQALIFVEQPLHRAVALDEPARRELSDWKDRPPIIIDESDSTLSTPHAAIEMGYAGTSHKNCKGVFKGVASACLLEHRRRRDRSRPYILSAEDLTNVGPIALPQDLCVVSSLGIVHAERNGHHYFKGLTMFPPAVQEAMLAAHPDLYRRHADGYATARIESGTLRVDSVIGRGFGIGAPIDVDAFTPASQWTFESLVGEAPSGDAAGGLKSPR